MSKGNKIPVIFFLFMLFGMAYGKIYYIEAYMEISPKGDVIINYTIIPKNVTSVKLFIEEPGKFILPEKCKEIEPNIIKCYFSGREKLKFTEISHVESYKKKFEFEKNIRIFDFVERSVFLVKLPEGALLPENTTKFFPLYGTIGTDGRSIFVVWERTDIQEGEIQGIKIFYEFPEKKEKFEFFGVIMLSLLIFAVASFATWLILFKRRKDVRDILLPVLKEDEKKIMEIVLRHPKGVNQKIIVQESNYSKGKVSKVLKSLSERGLVRLERMGRTNIVYPIFDFEKK